MRSWSTNRARQLLDVADSRFRPHRNGRQIAAKLLDTFTGCPIPNVARPRLHSRA